MYMYTYVCYVCMHHVSDEYVYLCSYVKTKKSLTYVHSVFTSICRDSREQYIIYTRELQSNICTYIYAYIHIYTICSCVYINACIITKTKKLKTFPISHVRGVMHTHILLINL